MRYLPAGAAFLMLYASAASAQSLPEVLTPRAGETQLRCQVETILPGLLYTVQEVAAGYVFSLPLAQYPAGPPDGGWSIAAGFTPRDGDGSETFVTEHIDSPGPSRSDVHGTSSYWLGFGTYSVRWALYDPQGRVCRKYWTVTLDRPDPRLPPLVAFPSSDYDYRTFDAFSRLKVRLGTPDGIVRMPARRAESADRPPGARRVTILMDAPSDRRGRIAMMDALDNLLARVAAPVVRLVVFSLEQGREIFRRDTFQTAASPEVWDAFASLEARAVSVEELRAQSMLAPGDLLDSIVQREIAASPHADAVIFLGMEPGLDGAAVRFSVEPVRPLPPVSYIQLWRPTRPPPLPRRDRQTGVIVVPKAEEADNPIPSVVRKLNGVRMLIDEGGSQFDQALGKLLRTIQPAAR